MKVIINTAALTPPLTGIGHYTAHLTQALMNAEQVTDIHGLAGSATHWLDRQQIKQLLDGPAASRPPQPGTELVTQEAALTLRIRQVLWRRFVAVAKYVPYARDVRRLLFRATAQRAAETYDDYIYWEPNYIALPLDNPAVITVYDLSHLAHPEYHPAERVEALTKDLERSIHSARRIITISEFTRDEIIREYGIASDLIDIVPPAVSDDFRNPASAQQVAAVRARHQLPTNYLLSVGTLEPRKNVEGLLRCYARLPQALRKKYPLVLAGVKGWLTGPLEKQLAPLVEAGEVRQLGYVDQADMATLYQQASALAYISFYEGYGMPVAEAMAAGTAVLTSDCASMPEVAQGAALLTTPGDDDKTTAQLERLLSDEALRAEMAEAGQKIAQDYSWKRSGELLLASLAKL